MGDDIRFTSEEVIFLDLPMKLAHFPELYPWPTKNTLQMMYRERETNGLGRAFKRFGGKDAIVYPKRLFELISELNDIPHKPRGKTVSDK